MICVAAFVNHSTFVAFCADDADRPICYESPGDVSNLAPILSRFLQFTCAFYMFSLSLSRIKLIAGNTLM
jgi:hypothetical protein